MEGGRRTPSTTPSNIPRIPSSLSGRPSEGSSMQRAMYSTYPLIRISMIPRGSEEREDMG
jgi:hypothetical protein